MWSGGEHGLFKLGQFPSSTSFAKKDRLSRGSGRFMSTVDFENANVAFLFHLVMPMLHVK